MEKRILLALFLTAIVIVATPIIFPTQRRAPVIDTSAIDSPGVIRAPVAAPERAMAPATPTPAQQPAGSVTTPVVDTTEVRTNHAIYHFVSAGGSPASVVLPEYRSLRPGAEPGTPANLLVAGDRLFRLRLMSDRDTIALDTVQFRVVDQQRTESDVRVSFAAVSPSVPVTLSYRIPLDSFVVHVSGRVQPADATGTGARDWRVVVQLPTSIHIDEANVEEAVRSLAVGYKKGVSDVESTWFRDLDTLEAQVDTGAIRWISERNKYFLVAAWPAQPDSAFRAVSFLGGPRTGEQATAVSAAALMNTDAGAFALDVFAGPQQWEHLRAAAAPELENVNPYGGFMHGLVQPFATLVMRLLLWMRHTFSVSYGWVLVLFGIAVRLLLWPLNQSAMRSGMKMQRLQPELAEVQKKYADAPEKQREAILKLYQSHGMTPFTPMLGCLPMLLPMPILFALYFVFQNTIELRGVSFLWLPDLSLRDPFYITPIFMGVSMFVLSWIGMRGAPPSPQSKMMAYVFPIMFTVLFFNFPSGLNLYYAVQNVAALPQQWLIARERSAGRAAATSPQPPPRTSGKRGR